jgi:glycosyltransferase involved in cell wall biosynthesis
MSTPAVSVCLATYRGAAWVTEQLDSILEQIGPDDEVVIVDDGSPDDTVARIRSVGDPRVRLIARHDNRGYVRAFEQALAEARGEFLLLADQDDVWTPGRAEAIIAALADADVVASNLATLGGPDAIRGPYGQADWHLRAGSSGHRLRNVLGVLIGNMPYYGCAMGLRRSALSTVLPFPALLTESHDLWLALYGNLRGRMRHVEFRSVRRRYHDQNSSPDRPRGPLLVLRSRWMLVRACVELLVRR